MIEIVTIRTEEQEKAQETNGSEVSTAYNHEIAGAGIWKRRDRRELR